MENKTDIEKALGKLSGNATTYEKPERYYNGNHDLAYATEKFKNAFGALFREFALNLCPAIVDAPKDKLKITNFKVEDGNENLPVEAWKIWQANRMGLRSGIIHKEALKKGDAYAIVWADALGKVTIYPQKTENCTVFYDEESPGKILWAAKTWMIADTSEGAKATDKRARLNVYYPDRIERYISKKKTEGALPLKADEYQEFADETQLAVIANPYGIVPMFHFANNADIGSFGMSELKNATPIQDALNKSVLDMMVAMEFASYRQRWAAGIEVEYDDAGLPKAPFMAGIERLWTTESPETKFGSFDSTDLKQFLDAKDSFRVDIASVTGTPIYYFIQTGANFPSGESLKKSETRFINKVLDRQESFGAVWEDLMSFALLLEGKGKDIRLFAEWDDPQALSEKETLENILIKRELGISDEQSLIEAGYGEADITRMLAEKQAKADAAVNVFNAGEEE